MDDIDEAVSGHAQLTFSSMRDEDVFARGGGATMLSSVRLPLRAGPETESPLQAPPFIAKVFPFTGDLITTVLHIS